MKYSVVLVDDEMVARAYIGGMRLWSEGEFVLVAQARNGEEALRYLEERHADILLMDVSMPGMNGVELSGAVRSRFPGVIQIALSNFDDYDYVRPIMRNGAYDYVLKDRLTEEGLRGILQSCVQRAGAHGRGESQRLLRGRLRDYMDAGGQGPCPLPNDGARLAASFARVEWPSSYDGQQRQAAASGIETLLESAEGENTGILALYFEGSGEENGWFVLFYRLYQTDSSQEIQRRLYYVQRRQEESIREMYHLNLRIEPAPQMHSMQAVLSYAVHRLQAGDATAPAAPAGSGLSLADQKALLSALEEPDDGRMRAILQGLLRAQDGGAETLLLKELIDLAAHAAQEWGARADFPAAGSAIFQWLSRTPREEACEAVTRLYVQLFASLAERRQPRCSEPVERALAFIRERFAGPISAQEVAAAARVSPAYLSRVFHRETGKTLTDAINGLRIERAQALIGQGRPLKEVASSCGFAQYTYFLKVFKAQTGMSPKNYTRKSEK